MPALVAALAAAAETPVPTDAEETSRQDLLPVSPPLSAAALVLLGSSLILFVFFAHVIVSSVARACEYLRVRNGESCKRFSPLKCIEMLQTKSSVFYV